MANGSSGISTTITDLSKWVINFQMPNVQTQSTFQEMEQKTTLNSGQTVEYGLGLEFKNYKGLDLVFHGGGDAAYRSYILNVPKYQFSVIVLGNANDFAPLKIVYNIVDLFLNEHQKEPLPPDKAIYTTQELKSFEGTYQMFPGTYYNIITQNDTLFFQSYGTKDKAPLPVIGDGKFLFPYISTANFSFYKNGFNFHIADFNYDCPRVNLEPPNAIEINLSAFIGLYKNNEFNTTYELIIENNQLVALHSLNKNIYLDPLSKDSFYSEASYFGKLDFVRNAEGKVIEFKLSGQNLRNIVFKKIK